MLHLNLFEPYCLDELIEVNILMPFALRDLTYLAESWLVVQPRAAVSMPARSNFEIERTIDPKRRDARMMIHLECTLRGPISIYIYQASWLIMVFCTHYFRW